MDPRTDTVSSARPSTIRRMFNDIAPTYDLLNHLLSFGLDILWRRRAVRLLEDMAGGRVLDLAAGSGDSALAALAIHPELVVAADFALEMLGVLGEKLRTAGAAADTVKLLSCDAHSLPFRDETFDAVTVAFGIRNFADRPRALREMLRVLKPDGAAVILELTKPESPLASRLFRFHSRAILPGVGRLLSRHGKAYTYLPSSIEEFPTEREFLGLMGDAGFIRNRAYSFTFGTATAFYGRKQEFPIVC